MKIRALLLSLCVTIVGCKTATTADQDVPFVEDDAASVTDDDGGVTSDGISGDAAACTSVGCPCADNSSCASKLCGLKGTAHVCVSCIVSNAGVEKCDGLDNNCDGLTDEATCPGDGKCLLGACDGATGQCHMEKAPDQASCEDGNACTLADKCATGTCIGTLANCDDGTPCTSDDCAPATGCVFAAVATTCDDNNPCTFADACSETTCVGTPKDCDDGNPCSTDACSGGVCLSTANTATCDDNDGCTQGDICGGLKCAGTVNCQDGDPCTLDACDSAKKTCTHTAKVGWATPDCSVCATGFTGANCDACADSGKIWPNCL